MNRVLHNKKPVWWQAIWLAIIACLASQCTPVASAAFGGPMGGFGRTIVTPRQAPRPHVRWQSQDWQIIALPIGDGVSVMLHYPKSSEKVAARAARFILQHMRELERAFGYRPRHSFMYVLYGTHSEFMQTYLFPIGETTLGVTDPQKLDVALSYDGDHQTFRRISMHELAHQFTVQQVQDAANEHGATWSPLGHLPLWFIEGLAEYRTFMGELDPETHAFLRDLVRRQNPREGHWLRPFFIEDVYSYVQTYRVGHAKVTFLAEVYGEEILQEILKNAYKMVPSQTPPKIDADPEAAKPRGRAPLSFAGLISSLTDEPPDTVQSRYERWTLGRFGCVQSKCETEEFLKSPVQSRMYPALGRFTDRFIVDKEGKIILYRLLDPHTGTASLELRRLDNPKKGVTVVQDNRPGIVSLFPFGRRSFALGPEVLAYAGRNRGSDVLEVRTYTMGKGRNGVSVGSSRRFNPAKEGIIQIREMSFSPDGRWLAFVGLDRSAQPDLWALDLKTETYTRLTSSDYSKREPDWGERGIVYSSDKTPDGKFNLLLLDPKRTLSTGEMVQPQVLTSARGQDHHSPRFGGPDKVVFSATASDGTSQIWTLELQPAQTQLKPDHGEDQNLYSQTVMYRNTNHPTGLWAPQPLIVPTSDGMHLFAMTIHQGRYQLAGLWNDAITRQDVSSAHIDAPGKPWTLPQEPVKELSRDYNPWSLSSWSLDQIFLSATTGFFGFGQAAAADRLKDRLVILHMAGYGSADLIDANLLYLNRASRMDWGVEVFHLINTRRDREVVSDWYYGPLFLERQFGVRGFLAYPLSHFTQFSFLFGAEGRYREAPYELFGEQRDTWKDQYAGPNPAIVMGGGFGFNALRYQFQTGPVQGTSFDIRAEGAYVPGLWDAEVLVVGDFQQYFRLGNRTNIGFRLASGSSLGSRFARDFLVSSWDNLRGLTFDDPNLRASKYLVSNLELQFPLNPLVAIAFFHDLEGILALDVGSVFEDWNRALSRRALAAVVGTNAQLGPMLFRLHFGYPIDIGGYMPNEGWVTQFSIRYLFW